MSVRTGIYVRRSFRQNRRILSCDYILHGHRFISVTKLDNTPFITILAALQIGVSLAATGRICIGDLDD